MQDLGGPAGSSNTLQEIRTLAKVKDNMAAAASYDDEVNYDRVKNYTHKQKQANTPLKKFKKNTLKPILRY